MADYPVLSADRIITEAAGSDAQRRRVCLPTRRNADDPWHTVAVSERAVRVEDFDHLVLRCADVERSLAWYVGRLGLIGVRVEAWRAGEVPFPSVRITPTTIIDLIPRPAGEVHPAERNVDHFCLVVDTESVTYAERSGQFDVVDGPGRRYGARGEATSIYVTDPDGNVVELRAYD